MADTTVQVANMNPNTTEGLSAEMRTYYSDYLIDNAVPNLVHDQFGQKQPIPANGGKTINFRKFVPFTKASKPLTEGITPDGGSLSVTNVTAEVSQYGYYVTLSDMLMLTAVDNTLVETTRLLGNQAGSTLDTVTREVLNSGTNVMYPKGKMARGIVGEGDVLTVDDVFKAARFLKAQNAPKIDGGYVAIIHPDVAYDLMRDPEWIDVNKYAETGNVFTGEIGKIGGVRFVESTEAKVIHTDDLTDEHRSFIITQGDLFNEGDVAEIGEAANYRMTIYETLSEKQAESLIGKKIQVFNSEAGLDEMATVEAVICGVSPSTNNIWITEYDINNCNFHPTGGNMVFPAGAGLKGRDIYTTLVMGANAYGVTEVTGGGLQHIVKQLGSGGSADPLDQRSTAGWKGTKAAELLVNNYLIRIESASTFEIGNN